MNIYEKLLNIQNELKAPKNQRNNFGNYNYRSCEDILEAVKPLNEKYKAALTVTDRIQLIGDRYYVEANALLYDIEKPEDKIIVQAYAREPQDKKGMDSSQVTGATSSYARKYALNGLYNIDDNKDADALPPDDKPKIESTPKTESKPKKITVAQLVTLKGLLTEERTPKLLEYFKIGKLEELTQEDFAKALTILKSEKGEKNETR